ncbi:hypothetical protein QSV34_05110 [Porticoccus sp. W117]|uniref:hypothetical protein n=1 Tax=Porticoccus sp. W117 TaxID=3054777 RepID=UPI002599AA72|nr:hypothetical protein [Porticoccus sp. W117]MDM3870727.1 hypothetical protein [Porticoccus sp. W117]
MLAVFDLNDSAIGHGSSADNWQHSPGFARLADGGIVTGEAARSRAWLNPQQSFQQYWQQLNLTPLAVHTNSARHHADLAYAQLQQLHKDSGEPGQVILAVPGSFNREQLGLLLGLAKALPFEAVGLVDSALAAVSTQPPTGTALHLDIQQHQSLITRLDKRGELCSVDHEAVSNLGLKQLLDHWAHQVADQFISQYRYDPLHTAEGEQQLYDQLPHWLASLQREPQVAVSLKSGKGNFEINLMREPLLASAEARLKQLQQAVEELWQNGETLYLSHRAAQIPGLRRRLGEHQVLASDAVLQGCLGHQQQLCSDPQSLHLINALQVAAQAPVADTTPAPQASHLLVGHRALAIGEQLALRATGSDVEPCEPEQADLVLTNNGSGLVLQTPSEVDVSAPSPLQPGAIIQLQQHRLQLIVVD